VKKNRVAKQVLWIRIGFNGDLDTNQDPEFFFAADSDPDPGF
jgi:hypothetical protein